MNLRQVIAQVRRPRPLTRATVELVNAANGLHPVTRNPWAAPTVFWFGWPTSEVPFVYAGVSAVDALRRSRRGDFDGPKGKVALALTAASWAILGVIAYRGVKTPGPVLESALTEQLGPDYTDALRQLPSELAGAPGRRNPPLRSTVARRRYVDKQNIVRYGPHGRANLADIWRRRDLPRDGKAPVLLQVPGGAWMIGWRRPQAYPLMEYLVSRGWVCVSMNYRVSPLHTWPDHIVDVKRALTWVKENIAKYGGDPNFVVISGGSAGGHLSSLAALTPNDPKFQPGFEESDTSVAAAVPFYGRYDWFSIDEPGRGEFLEVLARLVVKKKISTHRDIYIDASPITYVRPDAPPFFVLHGADDSLIPVQEARDFVDELRAVSKSPVAYAELPNAQHAFDIFASPRAHKSAEAVARFLSWVYVTKYLGDR
ncbi:MULTISPECIES: alpha/beta hydrolase [Mycobacterium]|uniref:Esterase n=1 Tax=Mycobacterium kiyosense TaxID=2871094 RepID=A0A9P3Q800_9MYCO|nr:MULTISPECIES: alpha/beta hydrolase [Mycobacterium]BDB43105.1 esterase [Mycobacterium kiyosense]BDE13686.1 esterase [Mycobacterium sp. 20KCMC460]GLB84487.1 esterase [Mycobacterium kiyosense]GLB89070.1 esterase [Mycobacterium kiyosense]GLB94326.1 esterase [Mycobacterium kiyosense]